MRKKKKREIDLKYRFVLVMLFIVIGIVLLSFSFSNNSILSSAINDIFYYPFRNLTNDVDIIGKNLNSELEKEILSLKELLNISSGMSDFEIINGVVVSRNPSYWLDEITVNRGSQDGIEEGMGVVVSEGLVGYVSQVASNYSVITFVVLQLM